MILYKQVFRLPYSFSKHADLAQTTNARLSFVREHETCNLVTRLSDLVPKFECQKVVGEFVTCAFFLHIP